MTDRDRQEIRREIDEHRRAIMREQEATEQAIEAASARVDKLRAIIAQKEALLTGATPQVTPQVEAKKRGRLKVK